MNLLLKYKHQCIIGVLAVALVIAICVPLMFPSSDAVLSQSDLDPCNPVEIESDSEDTDYVVVDIKGEVKNPGVYTMPSGSIVQDVIDAAGGLKSTAYTKNINLSKAVTNEMVIIIYSKSEMKTSTTTVAADVNNDAESSTQESSALISSDSCDCVCDASSTSTTTETSSLVNINTASKETLMTISGIGSSKADAIIIYRTEQPFTTIEDIKNVSGIGESLYAKIKDYITV